MYTINIPIGTTVLQHLTQVMFKAKETRVILEIIIVDMVIIIPMYTTNLMRMD